MVSIEKGGLTTGVFNRDAMLKHLTGALELLPSVRVTRSYAAPDRLCVEMSISSQAALAQVMYCCHATGNRMEVVLDVHPYPEVMKRPDSVRFLLIADPARFTEGTSSLHSFAAFLVQDFETEGLISSDEATVLKQNMFGGLPWAAVALEVARKAANG